MQDWLGQKAEDLRILARSTNHQVDEAWMRSAKKQRKSRLHGSTRIIQGWIETMHQRKSIQGKSVKGLRTHRNYSVLRREQHRRKGASISCSSERNSHHRIYPLTRVWRYRRKRPSPKTMPKDLFKVTGKLQ